MKAHGTPGRYRAGCRCADCRTAFFEHRRATLAANPPCEFAGCARPSVARGLCGSHYKQRHVYGLELRPLKSDVSNRILDMLDIDGGWLTADGLSADLDGSAESIERTLYRLRAKGLVESRIVELAGAGRNRRMETRVEWRFK